MTKPTVRFYARPMDAGVENVDTAAMEAGLEIDGVPVPEGANPEQPIQQRLKEIFGLEPGKVTTRFLVLLMYLALHAKRRGGTLFARPIDELATLKGWRPDLHNNRSGVTGKFKGNGTDGRRGVFYSDKKVYWNVDANIEFDSEETCRLYAFTDDDSVGRRKRRQVRPIETYRNGSVLVYANWDWDVISSEIVSINGTVVEIAFRQTWVPNLEVGALNGLSRMLQDESKRLKGWVYLLGSRDQMRSRIEGRPEDIDEARDYLRRTMEFLRRRFRAVHPGNVDEEQDSLCIGFYSFMPFGPILRVGDQAMFVGFYPGDDSSDNAPMMLIRDVPELAGVWEFYEDQLELTHRKRYVETPEWIA